MPQFRFNTISRADIERSQGGNIMIQAIDYEGNDHQLVSGRPGSGKTTISLKRIERLANKSNYKILFITYQILLAESLKNVVAENARGSIHRINMWLYQQIGQFNSEDSAEELIARIPKTLYFDEIIVDEGQDLELRFLMLLKSKAKKITIGADNAQRLHSTGISINEISEELEKTKPIVNVRLNYNYRNSYELYNFARFFVPTDPQANNAVILSSMTRKPETKPIVIQTITETELEDKVRVIIENNSTKNIAVILFHTEDVDRFYTMINNLGFDCIKYYYGLVIPNDFKSIVVTTYFSVKGLEFEVVIMPDMHNAFTNDRHTGSHYYVGCTRAKESLYLTYTGDSLPNWLAEFRKDSYEFRPSETNNQQIGKTNISIDDLPF
jgi:DNA helicase IV